MKRTYKMRGQVHDHLYDTVFAEGRRESDLYGRVYDALDKAKIRKVGKRGYQAIVEFTDDEADVVLWVLDMDGDPFEMDAEMRPWCRMMRDAAKRMRTVRMADP